MTDLQKLVTAPRAAPDREFRDHLHQVIDMQKLVTAMRAAPNREFRDHLHQVIDMLVQRIEAGDIEAGDIEE